jgi:hypothetical protein
MHSIGEGNSISKTIEGFADTATKGHTMFDLRRWARAVQLALISFLATAWFLSRTYAAGLFVLLALAAVLKRLATQQLGLQKSAPREWRLVTTATAFASVIVIYVMVRLRL